MRTYVVKDGDYLGKIAHALRVDGKDLWNHPKNADLRQKRDPNLLNPGDILHVPNADPKRLPLNAGTSNVYVATIPRTVVRMAFQHLDKPLANEPYEIHGLGEPEEGKTDANGGVEFTVPVHLREVQITFKNAHVTYPVHIGDMDPVEEISGVRKRLAHLGYDVKGTGPNPDADEALRSAIKTFQAGHGIEASGHVDDATKSALVGAHGA